MPKKSKELKSKVSWGDALDLCNELISDLDRIYDNGIKIDVVTEIERKIASEERVTVKQIEMLKKIRSYVNKCFEEHGASK